MSLVCSLFLLVGCSGFAIGPTIERKAIIVRAGTGIEILDQVTVKGHVLKDSTDDKVESFEQDIGGWIAMHPDHWEAVKREINRLRVKVGEAKPPNPLVPPGGQ
jgi:hypothetical protein